jgi:diguanylate cyclase (GGDEF)-like protein
VDRARGQVREKPAELTTVRAVRRNALSGCVLPLLVDVYLVLTWSRPHRAVMLLITLVLLVQCAVSYATSTRRARAAARPGIAVDVAVIAAHLAAAAVLAYLDGGVATPLGLLLLITPVVLSTTVGAPLLLGATAAAVAAFAVVAVVGGSSPRGYVVVYPLAFLVITAACALHSHGLTSLRRRLVDVCRIDPLTQCLNRAGFEARLQQELSRSARVGDTMVLVLLDLDGFKEVNDSHGHAVGDELLRWTARTLQEGARAHDVVARVGGDEFAAVLSGLTADGGAAAVQRFQRLLGTRSPASVGMAVYPDDGVDVESLRHRADVRLYQDKARRGHGGRGARSYVPGADPGTATEPRQRVTRHERLRRAIEQTGWLITADFAVGLLYAWAFSPPLHRPLILLACLGGTVLGLALALGADHLSTARSAGRIMAAAALLGLALAGLVAVLDGGLVSPLSLGILSPIPLVALTTPWRRAVVLGAGMAATYVAVGTVVGGITVWFVISHLVVFLLLSMICAAQGHLAAQQRRRLFTLSRSDVLTEVLNRRGFEEHVTSALARASRGGTQPSLVLIDLDSFKAVNDTLGHAAGDELLLWVATTLRAAVRAEDSVARLGGDEFAVLLSSCPAVEAPAVADRLRAMLSERTSVSIGTASLPDHGADLEALYWHADALLYAEKSTRASSRVPRG